MPPLRAAAVLGLALLAACAAPAPEFGADAPASGDRRPQRTTLAVGALETGGPGLAMRVSSIRQRRFASTIRQQYDFSCGSAALATLLTFHYGRPTAEAEVFQDMLAHGDEERIRSLGFSLLDMQRFLARQGLNANGYRLPLDRLAEARVPAIALIDNNGYRHFVVLRGIARDRVLLADPNLGTRTVPRDRFEASWNGVLFLILDQAEAAQASFGLAEDWGVRPRAPGETVQDALARQPNGMGIPAPLLLNSGRPDARFMWF